MTGIEVIKLTLFLAMITVIYNFIYWIVSLFIWFCKDSYRVINGFKKQLSDGKITIEEYNRKVKEFDEKCKSGEIDRKRR